ncbi:probable dolichyl pyrophosphate Glc1Man9GlcNAc2 alpha-1,3-glucosyltransferase isoform X1 [Rhagoletis pomonella]|uniref:probable dolichyl pyrophosphate Glc1Man9GlcNAc2 alpha-1,3-glucosyltransferase isoform X1 n=2 Tax=Rhagoletis pomonella TaxID=28610 RepID=UPI00178661EF|nr:probable dolichyl pyrophosphate Glc1Man9GlcNAc2 alpha-1,3-glucosyltransferase isoform X1 [Rhagoletis pomonella]
MESHFWKIFTISSAVKFMLAASPHSTDFEVHRNWLAITHSLPMKDWYYDETSEWTLDYPPFFAYFEWLLSQVAHYVDPQMLVVKNLNYASTATIYFQRCSVIVTDLLYSYGAWRCLRALNIPKRSQRHFAGEVLLLFNVGLLFVDHIHFQYNGFLFGLLFLSISLLLEERYLLSAFTFAVLLNFKHIFLYMAPAFAFYLLKFYCLDVGRNPFISIAKLGVVGLTPFVASFGPFYDDLPQVVTRLFPFKRGLTHAYWAPNFWALYNTADKVAARLLHIKNPSGSTTTSGLVQEFEPIVLPNITPRTTFVLTVLFMLPVLIKLFCFTTKSTSKINFLRAVVLCSCASFMFGWHVHEKAILMCLLPLSLLCLLHPADAKYAFWLGVVGYFSLFPLLFQSNLLLLRYSLYLGYIAFMYGQLVRLHPNSPDLKMYLIEDIYIFGFLLLPVYEHLLSPILGLQEKLPFMPLLLTSLYCSVGVISFFISYYLHMLDLSHRIFLRSTSDLLAKSKLNEKLKDKVKSKAKSKPKVQ